MSDDITLEEFKKAYIEMTKQEAKRAFIAHLVAYVLVNVMLIVVNLVYAPEKIWFPYPLIGWGIGVIAHYLYGVRWVEESIEEELAKAEYLARKMRGQGQQRSRVNKPE